MKNLELRTLTAVELYDAQRAPLSDLDEMSDSEVERLLQCEEAYWTIESDIFEFEFDLEL